LISDYIIYTPTETEIEMNRTDDRPRIQFDAANWFLAGMGTRNGGSTYCHLVACFAMQRDGKTPVQISAWVPDTVLRRAGVAR
jgi:hypothetical protein